MSASMSEMWINKTKLPITVAVGVGDTAPTKSGNGFHGEGESELLVCSQPGGDIYQGERHSSDVTLK